MKDARTLLTVIERQLHQLMDGGNWLDESFHKKLKDIAATDAFTRPLPEIHCVAEIVWHCIYWHTVNIERLNGNPQYRHETIEEQNFLPIEKLKVMSWTTLKEKLRQSFDTLLAVLEGKHDSFLKQEYEPAKTHEAMLLGTIEHDAYHLGQIGLVVKMLSVRM